ncbi:MAG: alpha/beta fold hydrolase [Myxococcota bacterium]
MPHNQLNMIAQVLTGANSVHRGLPTPEPRLTNDIRYPGAQPPAYSSNVHGELEALNESGADATHWFVRAANVTFHVVTAGNPEHEALLFVHGFPESWHAWHHQMADLSLDYYVIAIDMKGYGQSDKGLELDYRARTMACEVAELMNVLGVERFNVVSHDRGAVLTDHLAAVPGMEERILRYVRMQQSGSEPHGKPLPPYKLFASQLGVRAFRSKVFPRAVFENRGLCTVALSEEELARIDFEWKVEGIAEATSNYFKTTSFDQEHADRHNDLFAHMTMPTLFLQGRHDPGQHPEEYEHVTDFVRNGYVRFVDAGHFLHREKPDAVTEAIRWLLRKPVAPAPVVAIEEARRPKYNSKHGSKKSIVVFGGLGQVGQALARHSVAQGHPTAIAVRRPDDVVAAFGPHLAAKLEVHETDSLDAESVARVMTDADIAINAAGHVNMGETFLELSEIFVRAAESALNRGKRAWMLGGMAALDVPHTSKPGDQLLWVPSPFKLHRHNVARLRESKLAWSMACPGIMLPAYPTPRDTSVRVSVDEMPLSLSPVVPRLPNPIRTAVMLPRIAKTKLTFDDFAAEMIRHVDDGELIGHRVGFGFA